MNIKKHLFLDLEDTIITPVIDGWFNTEIINLEKIKKIIDEFKPDEISIFSFAIWNDNELRKFNDGTKWLIEDLLQRKISMVPTVEGKITKNCCEIMKINPNTVDFSDVCAFWSKHESFRLFCRSEFKNSWKNWNIKTEVMLLDDMVINETFEWKDLKIKGTILNIDEI